MKIAVTGASGFIGHYVIDELVRRELDVLAVTRSASNLQNGGHRVKIIETDIARADCDTLAKLAKVDVLIHLAWSGLSNYESRHHFEVELPTHYLFLKKLVEMRLPACLVAGTCFEYGIQNGELSESSPTMPVNPYGFAKDALRRQLEFLAAHIPFSLMWARLFYVFGEGQAKSSLYSQFLSAVRRGDATFDMSGGEQLRDYLPVGVVARLLVDLAISRKNTGPINVCSGIPISVRRLVESWRQQTGSSIRLNLGRYPYPEYEPMAFWGGTRKLNGYAG